MGLITSLWLALLGVLGASQLIIAKKPDAKELIAKMAPYQGWFGASSAIWGAWIIVSAILNINWLSLGLRVTIWWATYLGMGVVLLGLGLLFGVGVLKTFTTNEEAHARLDQTVAKLAPKQGILGIISIGLGVWGLIANFILR